MISSKKLIPLGIILILLVLILLISAMVFKDFLFTPPKTGDIILDKQHSVTLFSDDYYTEHASNGIVKITLNGDTISSGSKGISFDNKKLIIARGGTYVITGTLNDGSIIINSSDETPIKLYLNGTNVTSSDYASLVILKAKKTIISLIPGTENTFTSKEIISSSDISDDIPTAAVYSKDDLVINGTGKLTVNGNKCDGIKANDTLKILESTVYVNSYDEGINVNDSLYTSKAKINIDSGSDAIRCEKSEPAQSFIYLSDSTFDITTDKDGIYSSGSVYLENITANIKTGGGSDSVMLNYDNFNGKKGGIGSFTGNRVKEDTPSTKGIKAGIKLNINGGTFKLDCVDDAIHSDGEITIDSATFNISTGNDAIHAETMLKLSPLIFNVTMCHEGIEGGYIYIDKGDFNIISSDDAINAVGTGSFGVNMPMMNSHSQSVSEEDIYLEITGGNINITSSGDGVDSNGAARVSGGNIRVYGPENGGNGSLDFQKGILLCGGTLIAAGNSGMAEAPHTESTQISLTFRLSENYGKDSTIEITDHKGNTLLSGTSSMKFNWVCVSSPEFKKSEEYTLKINGDAVTSVTADGIITANALYGRR